MATSPRKSSRKKTVVKAGKPAKAATKAKVAKAGAGKKQVKSAKKVAKAVKKSAKAGRAVTGSEAKKAKKAAGKVAGVKKAAKAASKSAVKGVVSKKAGKSGKITKKAVARKVGKSVKTAARSKATKGKTREKTRVAKRSRNNFENIKATLLERRQQILSSLGKLTGVASDSGSKPVGDRVDDAVMDLALDSSYAIAEREVEELRSIDTALENIEDGSYGICEECGERIEKPRLKALPYAVLCLKCKQAEEMEQALSGGY